MPTPQSHTSKELWGRLFLGGAGAVVLVLAALVVWRFVQVLHPDRQTVNEKTASLQPAPPRPVVPIQPESIPEETAVPTPAEDIPATEKQSPSDPESVPADPAAPMPKVLTADQIVERRLKKGEEELRRELLAVPEVRPMSDFEVREIREAEKAARPQGRSRVNRESSDFGFNLRLHREMKQAAVASGLVLRSELNCRLDSSTAKIMAELSKDLRDMGFVSIPGGRPVFRLPGGARIVPAEEEEPEKQQRAFQKWCDLNKVEQLSATLPTLVQMLQVENVPIRLTLVRELGRIKSPGSTAALASRAMVDLSPEVRAAAVAALESRPPHLYVPALLRGLRYPWPAVADHAAVALRQLAAADAVSGLVDLLDQPDPSSPVPDPQAGQDVRYELVRLNHLRNCLLCHAPSSNPKDGLVRGLVPTPGEPLPRLYYQAQVGDFVRADITYVHQDFSVVLPEKDVATWPAEQRFDFVMRKQPAPAKEITTPGKGPDIYPQREAVLYALRGLTRKDAGDSSTKWREMLGLTEKKKPAAPPKDITHKP